MKKNKITTLVLMFALLIPAADTWARFCWKSSYGRGVGTVLHNCSSDKVKIGALCYSKCPENSKRFGFDCHSLCPKNMRDDGLFCRAAEYGRGTGFAWRFSDWFSDNGMRTRCESKHGKGKCEIWGAIYYPKCAKGYKPFGCCICRPAVPNCDELGLNPGLDLSCAKKVVIGDPVPLGCSPDEDNQAALCYKKCNKTFTGVGPVCWGSVPKGWVNCGLGAASDTQSCKEVIYEQVETVFLVALNVATAGVAKHIKNIPNDRKRKRFEKILELYIKFHKSGGLKVAHRIAASNEFRLQLTEILQIDDSTLTAEDISRIVLEFIGLIDPSGVVSTTAAYTYPTCDKIIDVNTFVDINEVMLGDFDGDKISDVFAMFDGKWYISYGGKTDWEELKSISTNSSQPKLGDFNADGKTDIFAHWGGKWHVSYNGQSNWKDLASSSATTSTIKLGDFNGDGKADVFTHWGGRWHVSYGGLAGWKDLAKSSVTINNLKLGDFNGDGKADVFTHWGGRWHVSYGGLAGWKDLAKSSATIDKLKLGDFNGDGKTDVFAHWGNKWHVSYGGISGWKDLANSDISTAYLKLGDFNGDGKSDVIAGWGGKWYVSYSGTSAWEELRKFKQNNTQSQQNNSGVHPGLPDDYIPLK